MRGGCSKARTGWRRHLRAGLAGACALLLGGAAQATDPQLKADLRDLKVAYLFNFAQFAEWPRDSWSPGVGPFVMCATSLEGVGAALGALEGRRLRGSVVVVSHPRNAQEARRCHLLYADGAGLPWLRQLSDVPVLVVGDGAGATAQALSFELRGDRLRWNVNLGAARQAGVRLNSKLVELALQVSDAPAERP